MNQGYATRIPTNGPGLFGQGMVTRLANALVLDRRITNACPMALNWSCEENIVWIPR
jgi:hypothetical protein